MAVRANNGRFLPGQSGNPGGKQGKQPKNIADFIKESDIKKGIKMLVDIMADPIAADKDRMKAFEILCDRKYGKPRQTVDTNVNIQDIQLPTVQLPPIDAPMPPADLSDADTTDRTSSSDIQKQ